MKGLRFSRTTVNIFIILRTTSNLSIAITVLCGVLFVRKSEEFHVQNFGSSRNSDSSNVDILNPCTPQKVKTLTILVKRLSYFMSCVHDFSLTDIMQDTWKTWVFHAVPISDNYGNQIYSQRIHLRLRPVVELKDFMGDGLTYVVFPAANNQSVDALLGTAAIITHLRTIPPTRRGNATVQCVRTGILDDLSRKEDGEPLQWCRISKLAKDAFLQGSKSAAYASKCCHSHRSRH